MDEKLPMVSVVIPVFNEERYLEDCLKSLMSLAYPQDRYEIIIVDNGSTDNTLNIAERYPARIFVAKGVKVGAVRNYGVKHANGSVIAFLDSDCVVPGDWLNRGVEGLELDSNTIKGGQYLLRDCPSWIEKYWVLDSSKETVSQTNLVGGCIFIRRTMFDEVGGFDESLNSGEDSELSEKLRERGYHVDIDPSLSVVHLGYPDNVSSFVKRQIWHSSDYVGKFPRSLRDKIFILTILFCIGVLLTIIGSMTSSLVFFSGLVFLLIPPMVLSIKRVYRSKTSVKIVDSGLIYVVDFLYLVGRMLGVMNGLKNIALRNRHTKIARR